MIGFFRYPDPFRSHGNSGHLFNYLIIWQRVVVWIIPRIATPHCVSAYSTEMMGIYPDYKRL